jgi:hypothetical protein
MGTAAVETNSLVGGFDPNIVDGGPATILKQALADDPEALARLAQTRTFQVRAETSSNNDPVTVLNLNANGVTWVGADGMRNITTKAWFRNVAGTTFGYSEHVQVVKGSAAGTTPVLSLSGESGPGAASTPFPNTSYRVRHMLSTTGNTPLYVTAAVAISGALAVVRCTGGVAGQDLRWLVEVDVGPLKIVPVAVT